MRKQCQDAHSRKRDLAASAAGLQVVLLGCLLAFFPGCGGGDSPEVAYEHVYTVRARVVKLPDGSVDSGFYAHHEPIPEYVSMNGKKGMPEMVMPFAVPDVSVLEGVAVGDVVEIVYGETFRPRVKQGVISITKLPSDTVLSFDGAEAEAEAEAAPATAE